ncbi:Gp15 family bacteriophage protein [Lysinibacillus sp. NPDC096418]|uniref:Gp15 family bacteriophage protein n=1 Tax=Lysinibacillus sp. NPDC096418 TaxID=3364138 RepID=UPI00381D1C0C
MFKLTDTLVNEVEINGSMYSLDMSFDNILSLIDMLNDKELGDAMQIIIGLEMLIVEPLECAIEDKAKIFFELYETLIDVAKEEDIEYDIEGNPMPVHSKEKEVDIYDIAQDAEYIYASFLQDYGIDLFDQQGILHWDKFRALLAGLREDTKFKKVLEIRQMELPTGKGSEKQRRQVEELKKAYALKPLD